MAFTSEPVRVAEQPWWQINEHRGTGLVGVMTRLHELVRPSRYLEIGHLTAGLFELAGCASLAIAPTMVSDRNIMGAKPSCFLFRQSSDAFFATHDPKRYLGGPVDLALLGGTRHFAGMLRNFMNVEKHAARRRHPVAQHHPDRRACRPFR